MKQVFAALLAAVQAEEEAESLARLSQLSVGMAQSQSSLVFVSAEIGTVNAYTVVVTWSQTVTQIPSVTIQVNGVTQSISNESSLGNTTSHVIPVLWHGSGDSVTVNGNAITNNIAWEALLDLQADTGVTESGGAVSAWADQSGNGRNFTQNTASLKPAKQTIESYPGIVWDGVDDVLEGLNFADNLSTLDVMCLTYFPEAVLIGGTVVTKGTDIFGAGLTPGWYIEGYGSLGTVYESEFISLSEVYWDASIPNAWHVWSTKIAFNPANASIYMDGSNANQFAGAEGTVDNISNSDIVRLGSDGGGTMESDMKIRALMMFYPSPPTADRAALETRLGARYGLTVP